MAESKDQGLSYLLVQTCKAHRGRLQARLAELGLYVGQELILMAVAHEPGISQSELVGELCVEPPTVTKMLQRLEASGWVARRSDEDDARVSRVYLTAQGDAVQAQLAAIWAEVEAQMSAGLSDVEAALFRRLLSQVLSSLSA